MAIIEFTTDEIATEEWRDVIGYEGIYSISNLGRVRRDKGGCGTRAGRLVKRTECDGYHRVNLSLHGKLKHCYVHHLVAAAFLPNRPEGVEIDHKDDCRSNSRASNLQYLTHAGNTQKAWATGRCVAGDAHWTRQHPERLARGNRHGSHINPGRNIKLTEAQVKEIRNLSSQGVRRSVIAEQYGIKYATVTGIVLRNNWRSI